MSKPRSNSELEPSSAWGGGSTAALGEDEEEEVIDASQVLEKERLVKEITGMQEGLRALLDRVADVDAEGAKLKASNETLQTYIDNLTRNNAVAAGVAQK